MKKGTAGGNDSTKDKDKLPNFPKKKKKKEKDKLQKKQELLDSTSLPAFDNNEPSTSGRDKDIEIEQGENPDPEESTSLFRKELADMPMGDILKLREKLGSKLYKKVVFDRDEKGEASEDLVDAEGTDLALPKRKQFKREHKKRPREVSAKKPVSMRRDVFSLSRKERWDPRFHADTGEYSEDHFRKNYAFVHDIQREEKELLKKELAQTDDEDKVSRITDIIHRMDNRDRANTEKKKKKQKIKEMRQKNMERMKLGKNPIFLKKSEIRKQELEEKYADLKRKGKLEKYLKRKAMKQKSGMPTSDKLEFVDDDDED